MRKRKALFLFGGLTVLLVGYVVWCSREYLIDPKITWDEGFPKADRVRFEDLLWAHTRQPRWSLAELGHDLIHPYQVKVIHVYVPAPANQECVVKLSGSGGEIELEYLRFDGAWNYMRSRKVAP